MSVPIGARSRFEVGVLVELGGCDVYKIIYSAVDEKPEVTCKYLKELVGANGFEPSTSWSRTRFHALLKSMDSC